MRLLIFILSIFAASCWTKSQKIHNQTSIDTNGAATPATPSLNQGHALDCTLNGRNNNAHADTAKPANDVTQPVWLQFKPGVDFDNFKVDTLIKTLKAPIQYTSNKLARRFKTVITETYKKTGLNFGGHYCFVEWGCGSPCQMSAIVDLSTGLVYDGVNAAVGYQFEKDSRLLIVNPPDSSGFYVDCAYCKPVLYVWHETMKRFEKR